MYLPRPAEALIGALLPCDLGDGIEVVHDVEELEIEMDCDLDDDAHHSTPYETIEVWDTLPFVLFEAGDQPPS